MSTYKISNLTVSNFTSTGATTLATITATSIDRATTGTLTLGGTATKITPSTNGQVTLGDSTHEWKDGYFSGTISTTNLVIDGYVIDPSGATSNQVLKYNGSSFVPATVSGLSDNLSDIYTNGSAGTQIITEDATRLGIAWQAYSGQTDNIMEWRDSDGYIFASFFTPQGGDPGALILGRGTALQIIRNDIITNISDDTVLITNDQAATNGVPIQYSPAINITGRAYSSNLTADVASIWSVQSKPTNGANIAGKLAISYTDNTAGINFIEKLTLLETGMHITGPLDCISAGTLSIGTSIATALTIGKIAIVATIPSTIIASATKPTIAAGTALGVNSSPSVAIVGTANYGTITLVTGSDNGSGTEMAILTNAASYTFPNGMAVQITYADNATATFLNQFVNGAGPLYVTTTTGGWKIESRTAIAFTSFGQKTLVLHYRADGW